MLTSQTILMLNLLRTAAGLTDAQDPTKAPRNTGIVATKSGHTHREPFIAQT